jgi:DsbC/DsbD-like thiol-disulfide interchange protein
MLVLNIPWSRWFRMLCLLPAWVLTPALHSSDFSDIKHVKLELVSEQDAVVPGKELSLGLYFDLEDGWHTYWLNPGDSGEPPRVTWSLPAGFEAGEIQWPFPERLGTPPFADYGYQQQAMLIVPIRPPAQLREGEPEKFVAAVHYLVCKEVCIPGQEHLELTLPVQNRAAGSPAHELFETARSKLPRPVPRDWKISVISTQEEFLLQLKNPELKGAPQFFPLEPEQIDNAATQPRTSIPGGVRLHLKKSTHLLKPIARLKGVIVFGHGKAYVIDAPVYLQLKRTRS